VGCDLLRGLAQPAQLRGQVHGAQHDAAVRVPLGLLLEHGEVGFERHPAVVVGGGGLGAHRDGALARSARGPRQGVRQAADDVAADVARQEPLEEGLSLVGREGRWRAGLRAPQAGHHPAQAPQGQCVGPRRVEAVCQLSIERQASQGSRHCEVGSAGRGRRLGDTERRRERAEEVGGGRGGLDGEACGQGGPRCRDERGLRCRGRRGARGQQRQTRARHEEVPCSPGAQRRVPACGAQDREGAERLGEAEGRAVLAQGVGGRGIGPERRQGAADGVGGQAVVEGSHPRQVAAWHGGRRVEQAAVGALGRNDADPGIQRVQSQAEGVPGLDGLGLLGALDGFADRLLDGIARAFGRGRGLGRQARQAPLDAAAKPADGLDPFVVRVPRAEEVAGGQEAVVRKPGLQDVALRGQAVATGLDLSEASEHRLGRNGLRGRLSGGLGLGLAAEAQPEDGLEDRVRRLVAPGRQRVARQGGRSAVASGALPWLAGKALGFGLRPGRHRALDLNRLPRVLRLGSQQGRRSGEQQDRGQRQAALCAEHRAPPGLSASRGPRAGSGRRRPCP